MAAILQNSVPVDGPQTLVKVRRRLQRNTLLEPRQGQRSRQCELPTSQLRSALPILIPKLTALGVDVREMLPVRLFRRKQARLALRNHRKIAIVDGRVAITGSQNLVAADFVAGITYEELVLRLT